MTRYRGDSYPDITATLTLNGLPVDLTDAASVTFTFNKASALIQLTGAITDAVGGEVVFPVDTTTFDTVGTFQYDIQVVFNDGKVGTFAKSSFNIIDDINKD